MYHWTHLELLRYFGIEELLNENNAKDIYNNISYQLQQESHTTRGLLKLQKVEVLCTTEDPLDDLKYHRVFKEQQQSNLIMSTAFRPDSAFAVEDPKMFIKYLEGLESITNKISNYGDYIEALESRIKYFHNNGCRLSDHGLSYLPYFETGSFDIDLLFNKLRDGKQLLELEVDYFKSETLKHLCKIYHEKGWVQQFHLGF